MTLTKEDLKNLEGLLTKQKKDIKSIYPTRGEFQALQEEVAELHRKVNTLLSSARH